MLPRSGAGPGRCDLSKDLTYSYIVIRLLLAAFATLGHLHVQTRWPRCDRALASHSWQGVLCPGPRGTPDFLQLTAQKQVSHSGCPSSVSCECLGHDIICKPPEAQVNPHSLHFSNS